MWSEPPFASGLFVDTGSILTAPYAKYLEKTMAWLDTQVSSHAWIEPSGGELLGGSGFNWYRYTPSKEAFIPSKEPPFGLVDSDFNKHDFWQHYRDVVNFCNTRWLISHSGNKSLAASAGSVPWSAFIDNWPVSVTGIGEYGKISQTTYFSHIADTFGYDPYPSLDGVFQSIPSKRWYTGKKSSNVNRQDVTTALSTIGKIRPYFINSGVLVSDQAWNEYVSSDYNSTPRDFIGGPSKTSGATYTWTAGGGDRATIETWYTSSFSYALHPLARINGEDDFFPPFSLQNILSISSGYVGRVDLSRIFQSVTGSLSGEFGSYPASTNKTYYGEWQWTPEDTTRKIVFGYIRISGDPAEWDDNPFHTANWGEDAVNMHSDDWADTIAQKLRDGDYTQLGTITYPKPSSQMSSSFNPSNNFGDMCPVFSGYDTVGSVGLDYASSGTWSVDLSPAYISVPPPTGSDNCLFIADFLDPLEFESKIEWRYRTEPPELLYSNQYYHTGVQVPGRSFDPFHTNPTTEQLLWENEPHMSGKPYWHEADKPAFTFELYRETYGEDLSAWADNLP